MGEPLWILAFDLVCRVANQGLIRLRLTPPGRPAVVQIGKRQLVERGFLSNHGPNTYKKGSPDG